MRRRFTILALAAALQIDGVAQAVAGQTIPLEHLPALKGDYFPLASTATGTTYHIYIRYPLGYADKPAERYPIVYLLDGDSAFPLLAAQHLFLTIDDKLPEAVVVGIAYGSFDSAVNRRDVDFGPRAADFSRFLSAELIPAVERRVRADPARRILVGQSYGGSFVLYSALTEPDLFWARIASNPSFRLRQDIWNDAAPAQRKDLRMFVISGTENAADARQKALEWSKSWTGRKPPWNVEQIDIAGGTHSADIPNAYRAALRRLFGWSPARAANAH